MFSETGLTRSQFSEFRRRNLIKMICEREWWTTEKYI